MAAPQPSLVQKLFVHALLFGLCVVMPGVVMLIMPVASTTMIRQDGKVSASVTKKVFFVIPFSTRTVAAVSGVNDVYQAGEWSQTSSSGPRNDPKRPQTRTEDLSWLTIQGSPAAVDVPVSPADIDRVRGEIRDFLQDQGQEHLSLFTVANWKISVVTGGLLSMLTLIYIGVLCWELVYRFTRKGP